MVKRPTHFTLTVAPSVTPEAASQNHQLGEKAFFGPSSCWFVKLTQLKAVRAVKMTRGESSRISLAFVSRPFSNVINPAPMAAVKVLHPLALRVRNIAGTVKTPQMADKSLIAT